MSIRLRHDRPSRPYGSLGLLLIILSTLALYLILFAWPLPADAETGLPEGPPDKLLRDIPAGTAAEPLRSNNPRLLRQRRVRIDATRIRGPHLRLNLFDDADYIVYRTRLAERKRDRFVWSGKVFGQPDSEVRLAVSAGAVSGTARIGNRLYRVRFERPGQLVVEEHLPGQPLPEHEPIPAEPNTLSEPPISAEVGTAAANGSVIDIMVVYTAAARNASGGTNAIQSRIDLAIAETNEAYLNSGINAQLNLVHTAEVAYTESGDMSVDLKRLRLIDDGHIDFVHGMRDTYGADLVSLVEFSPDFCGIAYVMQQVSTSFATHGFSVVHDACLTGFYVFGHEVGHNQGSNHDRANTSGSGAFPYSFGYQEPNEAFRTVMSYQCPGGCSRIQHFSNPNVLFNGLATGIDDNLNPQDSADNARSINNTRDTVANLRPSVASLPPAAPLQLSAIAVSQSRIDLAWSDQSANETGFRVESSADSNQWSEIATVPADSQSFQDAGLPSGTTRYFRVRAFNSAGNSNYTNIAMATTNQASGNSAAIGNRVWQDANRNGMQDHGESGLSGVTVNLRGCNGGVLDTVLTDGSGIYRFSQLAAGSYQIEFVSPASYNFSPRGQGSGGIDSDPDPATGLTNCKSLTDGQQRLGIDAGMILSVATGTGAIGNRVWNDANGDGLQNNGESGVPGIVVELRDCSVVLATAQTSASGAYLFDDLATGRYQVRVQLPAGFVFSPPGLGSGGLNSDADPATGLTACRTLANGQRRLGIDVGLVPQGSGTGAIGNRVWNDTNANGIQNAGEAGLAGVGVRLRDCSGNLLRSTTSSSSGGYLFDSLAAGSYLLEFVPPSGFVFSPSGQAGGGQDSDPDPVTGTTACRPLAAGQTRMGLDAGMHR